MTAILLGLRDATPYLRRLAVICRERCLRCSRGWIALSGHRHRAAVFACSLLALGLRPTASAAQGGTHQTVCQWRQIGPDRSAPASGLSVFDPIAATRVRGRAELLLQGFAQEADSGPTRIVVVGEAVDDSRVHEILRVPARPASVSVFRVAGTGGKRLVLAVPRDSQGFGASKSFLSVDVSRTPQPLQFPTRIFPGDAGHGGDHRFRPSFVQAPLGLARQVYVVGLSSSRSIVGLEAPPSTLYSSASLSGDTLTVVVIAGSAPRAAIRYRQFEVRKREAPLPLSDWRTVYSNVSSDLHWIRARSTTAGMRLLWWEMSHGILKLRSGLLTPGGQWQEAGSELSAFYATLASAITPSGTVLLAHKDGESIQITEMEERKGGSHSLPPDSDVLVALATSDSTVIVWHGELLSPRVPTVQVRETRFERVCQ